MKEPYAKPKMVTEKLEIGALLANGSATPIDQIQAYFGLCSLCTYP